MMLVTIDTEIATVGFSNLLRKDVNEKQIATVVLSVLFRKDVRIIASRQGFTQSETLTKIVIDTMTASHRINLN
jgi:hypothetical protein